MTSLSAQIQKLTAFVLDASRYQVRIIGKVLKQNRVAAVILKASGGIAKDSRFEQHYKELQEAEIPTPAYHWLDPIYTPERNVDFFLSVCSGKNVPFYVLDIEQWWNCWASWGAAQAKRLAWSLVPRITPDKIARHAHAAVHYLSSKTNKPVLVYTSRGFVRSYAPGMAEWLGRFDNWTANYVISSPTKIYTTWDELYRRYLPTGRLPLLPDGVRIDRVRGWQYSGDLIGLPGIYADERMTRPSMLDLNIFDPAWLEQVIGGTIVKTPAPAIVPTSPQYFVSDWVTRGLNFRIKPNTGAQVLATLPAKTQLDHTGGRSGDWLEMRHEGKAGWVHSAYVTKL
jgi:GH25 family lysozyme M1 (1,4-beta-N-acetylmuramidase)